MQFIVRVSAEGVFIFVFKGERPQATPLIVVVIGVDLPLGGGAAHIGIVLGAHLVGLLPVEVNFGLVRLAVVARRPLG